MFSKKTLSTYVLGLSSLVFLASCSSFKQTPVVIEMDDAYSRLPAAACESSRYKVCKEARRNDVAQEYMLAHDGTLFRKINSTVCAVTSGVESFKISQHPQDVAVIYFEKGGDLYLLNKDREVRRRGECPSSKGNIKLLMNQVEKYTVTSNVNTTIVNAAVNRYGDFKAWDNVNVVYSDTNVEEFQMNSCYKQSGKSFSSYVLFTRDRGDQITKVKVTSGRYIKDASRTTSERFNSISSFVSRMNVCR